MQVVRKWRGPCARWRFEMMDDQGVITGPYTTSDLSIMSGEPVRAILRRLSEDVPLHELLGPSARRPKEENVPWSSQPEPPITAAMVTVLVEATGI